MIQRTIETLAFEEGWNPTTTSNLLAQLLNDLVKNGRIEEKEITDYLEARRAIHNGPLSINVGNSPDKQVTISDIDWDDDDSGVDLPESVVVCFPSSEEADLEFADILSDEYGFCVNSFGMSDPENIT